MAKTSKEQTMDAHYVKTKEDQSQSFSDAVSQRQNHSKQGLWFVDNRPEAVAQRKLQEMANNSPQAKKALQLQATVDEYFSQQQHPIQKKDNNTGLPDGLKTGIENLSGYSMDDVKVHYNSHKPAQLQAHAYAQGSDIHIASGQEKHLAHEAWHVVQQKQGRVKPTMQMKGTVNVNNDAGLEKEADVMGKQALAVGNTQKTVNQLAKKSTNLSTQTVLQPVVQAFGLANVVLDMDPESGAPYVHNINFKERVPTTTPGSSQGDHTVAEALIEASIRSLEHNSIPDFLLGLQILMRRNLTGAESALHSNERGDSRYTIAPAEVSAEIGHILESLEEISPFLLSRELSDVTTKVWRLLSKRDLTAFDRREGVTTGGGHGVEEAAAMRDIRALEVPERGWNQGPFIERVAHILASLIDFDVDNMPDDRQRHLCRRAAEHVGDVLHIESADWKNRVAAAAYNFKHQAGDGMRMAPAPAPPPATF